MQATTKRKKSGQGGKKIVYSLNSHHFFIKEALIVFEEYGYRLVAYSDIKKEINKSFVIKRFDKSFKTLKGAKIAFYKLYIHNTRYANKKTFWSHAYKPEHSWLNSKMNIVVLND